MIEYCKYLKIHDRHDKMIKNCKQHYDNCHLLCAFFIAYHNEILKKL